MAIKFQPQSYNISDKAMTDFIDCDEIEQILQENQNPTAEQVREIIQKSLNKQRLSLHETATLLNADSPELIAEIKQAAKELKERIYGKRIVLFAPLYIGNLCINNCTYCGFRKENTKQIRTTLNEQELISEVENLQDAGHKRLILVYGEHPKYNADFIAQSVKTVCGVKHNKGEIRRVNINAAPLDIEGFKKVKESGIGTYQIFQETYHKPTYQLIHPSGPKKDFDWRITSLDRAMEGGIDDLGIGALLGLYNWKYEVLGLLRHVNHFEAVYNIGPHTISFPRLQDASGINTDPKWKVSDEEFTRLVAILRLAVPYTGLILTAREPAAIRDEVLQYGVSQIDGGTNIELKGYSNKKEQQDLDEEQFKISDDRSLSEVMDELVQKGFIPSFCTACYRLNRTGEHFMEFSVPGFIKRYCQPNALLTFAEYLEDYASEDSKAKGYKLISDELTSYSDDKFKLRLEEKLAQIKEGKRDLYF